jgi:hypothetical protein
MKFESRTAGCGGGAPGFKSKPLTAGTQMVPACQIRDGVGHTRQMEQHGHYKTEKSSMRSVRLCDSILDCCRVDSILAQGERQRVQLGMATPRLRRRWNATYHSLALLVAPRELHLRVPPR